MRKRDEEEDLEDVVVAHMYQPRYAGVECACNPEALRGRNVTTWKKLRTYRAEGNASLSCLPRVSSEYLLEPHTSFRPARHDHGTRSSDLPVHTQLGRRKETRAEKGKQGSRITSVQTLPDSEHTRADPKPSGALTPEPETESILPGIGLGIQLEPQHGFHEPFRSQRKTPDRSLVMYSITSQSVLAFHCDSWVTETIVWPCAEEDGKIPEVWRCAFHRDTPCHRGCDVARCPWP